MQDLKLVIKREEIFSPYKIKDIIVGKDFLKIGGPCSIDSSDQILRIAEAVKASGGNIIRGVHLNHERHLIRFEVR